MIQDIEVIRKMNLSVASGKCTIEFIAESKAVEEVAFYADVVEAFESLRKYKKYIGWTFGDIKIEINKDDREIECALISEYLNSIETTVKKIRRIVDK